MQMFLSIIVVTCMVTYVHGSCSMSQLSACNVPLTDCTNVLYTIACYEGCEVTVPDMLHEKSRELNCVVTNVPESCSDDELNKCMPLVLNCTNWLESKNCYKRCDRDIPAKIIDKALKGLGCGASALTNIGLPMMLLVVLAVFYNK